MSEHKLMQQTDFTVKKSKRKPEQQNWQKSSRTPQNKIDFAKLIHLKSSGHKKKQNMTPKIAKN